MLLDSRAAIALLEETLQDLWNREHRPILGSKLKIEVLRRARERDLRFEERTLGFRRFSEFVAASGVAEISETGGADVLITPKQIPHSRATRIRPDFWHAFMSFPVAGQARAYDPTTDKITTAQAEKLGEGLLPITPVSKEQQLEWRREFAQQSEIPDGHWLKELKVENDSGLRAFSGAMRNDSLRPKWNAFWLQKAMAVIRQWADQHSLPERIWVSSAEEIRPQRSSPGSLSTALASQREPEREKLYAVLDQLSLDHLLEITIPLRWLLK